MKQSSIDWIYNNLKSHFENDGDLLEAVKMSFEQAKAMHKEEIKEAYWNGSDGIETKTEILQIGEQYYNETYGGNNEQQ